MEISNSVYVITNQLNGKQYVGITTRTIKQRFSEHCKANFGIGKAIKKYGESNFTVHEIDKAETWEELCEKEIHYISEYDTFKNGYNQTLGGDGMSTVVDEPYILNSSERRALYKIKQAKDKLPREEIITPLEILVRCLELLFTCEYISERKDVAKGIKKFSLQHRETLFRIYSILCPFVDENYIDDLAKS
uniref:GIY-YIG nuclease family protein n=1 Tax=Aerococcus urinaeequi TaxID=51665 RepID=UPI00352AC5B1